MRAPKHVLGLFAEKFAGLAEELDAGFGFDMARLSVPVTAPDAPAQIDLAGDAAGEADLGQLIDRIGARIGPERVRRIVARDSHIPERSEAWRISMPTTPKVPPRRKAGEGDHPKDGGGGARAQRWRAGTAEGGGGGAGFGRRRRNEA